MKTNQDDNWPSQCLACVELYLLITGGSRSEFLGMLKRLAEESVPCRFDGISSNSKGSDRASAAADAS